MNNPITFFFLHGTVYCLFFCLLLVAKAKKTHRLIADDGSFKPSALLLWLHAGGILLFGVLSFAVYPSQLQLHLWPQVNYEATATTVLLFLLLLFLSPALASKKSTEASLQTAQETNLSAKFLAVYFLLRVLFIAAYELWFRGFLLEASIDLFSTEVAIFLNIGLYTLLHIVNGKKEMLGCIPFGLLLCSLCIWQGAVWPAVVLHLALTLSYEGALLQKLKNKTLPHEALSHRRIGLHRG